MFGRSLFPLALVLLGGCPESGHDADSLPLDAVFSTEEDVRLALATVELPYLVAFSGTPDPNVPHACPHVVKDGAGYTMTGGCTADDGRRFEGSAVITVQPRGMGVDYTFTYDAFSISSPEFSITVDGTLRADMRSSDCGFPGPAPLRTDDLSLSVSGMGVETFGGFFPGTGRTVEVRYRDYQYAWDLRCEPSTITAHGFIELDGVGTFEATSNRQEAQSCQRESISGTVTLAGADQLTVTHDAAAQCDDCLAYQVDGGVAGSLCW